MYRSSANPGQQNGGGGLGSPMHHSTNTMKVLKQKYKKNVETIPFEIFIRIRRTKIQ